ncbi:hypothetical protein P875_00076311 [Aspergillus parasiticus SU-1]|uniref:Rhodopsin domain-containing protein n=1 Tax=Aspergillus parasiticus (strain ATCC 56775 / NRRL 5862 / SRRC 143 / SU-1) TaxID=1403190 RepID=A0A0F0IM56_ASPPU|nr:hypothetical protein P875_00076311 [Aspergillus parasiticus SU-1]
MAWTVALEGWTRVQARDSLSHEAYESINQALVIFGLVTGTLSLVVHTYTSVFITRQFGIHNVFTIIAWMLAVATQGLTLYGFSDGGLGKHEATLSESELARFTVIILAIVVTFIPLVCVAKLSLIMLYYRLSPHVKLWRFCIYGIATLITLPSLILVLLYLFGCQPVAKAWDSTITEGHCVDRLSIMLASSVLNVLTDFLMIIAPIPLIWKLNMRKHKADYSSTIITSIFRAITVDNLLYEGDHPYHMAVPILWANAETVLVIICDCLPSLRPFLHRHCPGGCFTGSEPSGVPPSETRNTRQHGRSRYFDDDIELIQNGSNPSRSMVITRTVEMELQYHKAEVDARLTKPSIP